MIDGTTIFNEVTLEYSHNSLDYVGLTNNGAFVDHFLASNFINPDTEQFQIIYNAILTGSAYEIYKTRYGIFTDSSLPEWLSSLKKLNLFHLARQRAETATDETSVHTVVAKKWLVAIDGLLPTRPNINYNSFAELKAGIEAAGWSILGGVIPTPADTTGMALYEFRLTYYTVADVFYTSAGDLGTETLRYSVDNTNWDTIQVDEDIYFSELQSDGTWQSYLLNPTTPAALPSGVHNRVEVGFIWASYSSAIIRSIDISSYTHAKVASVELRVEVLDNWADQKLTSGNTVMFDAGLVPMITPTQFSMVDDSDGHDGVGWRWLLKEGGTNIEQGVDVDRNLTAARGDHHVAAVALVTYPQMEVLEDSSEDIPDTQLRIDSALMLTAGDKLYARTTTSIGAATYTETMKFLNVASSGTTSQGEPYDLINVERAIDGTLMIPAHSESRISLRGIVNQPDVMRYITVYSSGGHHSPSRITGFLHLKP